MLLLLLPFQEYVIRLAELRSIADIVLVFLVVYGVLKLGLEVLLPLVRLARRGEAIRVGAVRNRPA